LDYAEDAIYRNMEPPLAFHLELRRLFNYDIQMWPNDNRQIHLYYAVEKKDHKNFFEAPHHCFFARAVIRGGYRNRFLAQMSLQQQSSQEANIEAYEALVQEAEYMLNEALNALEVAMGDSKFKKQKPWNNHIFMKFVPEVTFEPSKVVDYIQNIANKYLKRLGKLQASLSYRLFTLIYRILNS
jgi:acetyl-CoA carboxylase/biotin carboxylase 1